MPANCPQKPVDEESTVALASTWFEKGTNHVEDKEYSEAVEAFSCSLRMVEHQATMFNAARAALLAKQYDVTIEIAEMIAAVAKDAETKTEAADLIEEARAAIPAPEPEPEPEHVVEPEPEPVPTLKPKDAQAEPPAGEGPSALRTTGIISVVVGGAGLVAGGVFQGLAGASKKTTGDTDDYSEYVEARDNIQKYQTGATVSFVAGGVLLGAGIVMVLLDGKQKEHADVSLVPAPNGVVVGGTF